MYTKTRGRQIIDGQNTALSKMKELEISSDLLKKESESSVENMKEFARWNKET